MNKNKFSFSSFLLRLGAALLLVFITFNPAQPYSYFYWALQPLLGEIGSFSIIKALAGVILLIGWAIFIRATTRSLGVIGTLLAVAFFGLLMWFIVDQGLVSASNLTAVTWLVLISLSGVLAVGISWSHIRRRISGQIDVDAVDTD